jgi:hypothetical protein
MTLAPALQWVAYLILFGIAVHAYYTATGAMADRNWGSDNDKR